MAKALVDVRILQREYLLAISRALTAELDLHDLLRMILQSGVEFVAGRAGMIVLAEPNTETFRVAAVYGIPPHLVDHFEPLVRGVPYREGHEREVIPELTSRLQQIAAKVGLGLTQVVRLPMVIGDEVIGLIYVFQSGTYYLGEDAISLLSSFAQQAAIAVKNARLYDQINKEKQQLDAILEHSADGIMILNANLEITVFNRALSDMVGWSAAQAIGRRYDDIVRWRSVKTALTLEEALANGWPLPGGTPIYVEGSVQRRHTDNLIALGITYAPLVDENGRLTDIIADARDLTRYREEEELQKTFISVVSHELKTPVSIIKGYAGTLRRQDANWSPEILDESLEVIEEESDNLTDLIDQLLEVSRLQAGAFSLEMSDGVIMPYLAFSVARKFGKQTKKHEISVQFSDDFPPIVGDERRLTQALNNLVSNAIKYSPEGGKIIIGGETGGDYVTVFVRDEGIGIPERQKSRIFQKFSRLDNALSRKTEGTGLGLYLTKSIVEAHNGRIWFSSNADSPGTTFTFSLPNQ